MKIALVGPGSVGLYLLAKLARAKLENAPVLFDHDSSRARRLYRGGITLEQNGAALHAGAGTFSIQREKEIDIAVLAVKSRAVPKAYQAIKKSLKKDGAILAVQNGISHLRELPASKTLFALFLAGCDRQEENVVRVFHEEHTPVLALAKHENAGAAQKIEEMLRQAGIEFIATGISAERLLWTKSLYNAALNPVSGVLMKKNGELLDSEPARELIRMAFEEGRAVLKARGIPLSFPSENPEEFPWHVLKNTAGNRSSMFQDLQAGRETEADQILKPFLIEARKRKIAVPVLENLYGIVKEYEKIRRAIVRN